jgi:Gpi18-like mannosyltransferase
MSVFYKGFKKYRFILLAYFALFLLGVYFMPSIGPGRYDIICWTTWSNYIFGNGISNIYKFGIDYLPLYQYFLFIYGQWQGSPEAILRNIDQLKIITLFFDFLAVFYAFRILNEFYKNQWKAFLLSLSILLNIAFFYNNAYYGQVDGVFTAMVFISVYYAIHKKVSVSFLFLVLALNFKLQAIIFVPFIGMLVFTEVWKKISFKNLIIWILPAAIIQILIFLPFILSGDMPALLKVVKSSMGRYPFVSMGAYNIWFWFFDNPFEIIDKNGIFGRSFNKYGLGLFIIAYFTAIWLLVKSNWSLLKNKELGNVAVDKILCIGALIPLVFFFFNTQMHSRYIHPSILFCGVYAVLSRKLWPYALLSVAYFVNLENSAKIMKGNTQAYDFFLFQPVLISIFYFLAMVLLFKDLFNFKFFKS